MVLPVAGVAQGTYSLGLKLVLVDVDEAGRVTDVVVLTVGKNFFGVKGDIDDGFNSVLSILKEFFANLNDFSTLRLFLW